MPVQDPPPAAGTPEAAVQQILACLVRDGDRWRLGPGWPRAAEAIRGGAVTASSWTELAEKLLALACFFATAKASPQAADAIVDLVRHIAVVRGLPLGGTDSPRPERLRPSAAAPGAAGLKPSNKSGVALRASRQRFPGG